VSIGEEATVMLGSSCEYSSCGDNLTCVSEVRESREEVESWDGDVCC
jgi:hypothetical protein